MSWTPAGRLNLGRFAIYATFLACACATDGPSASAARLYVTSGFTDEVFVLSPTDGGVLSTISLDTRREEVDEPHGLVVSGDGAHWYATLSHGEPTLWKFEADGNRLVGRLSLGTPGAARIGLTPDGRRAFVPDYWRSGMGKESRVAVVALHDLELVAAPVVCPAPHDAQVDPPGRTVAVACSLSDEIVLLDAESLEPEARFFVGEDPGPAGAPRWKPLNVAWSPDGEVLYVTAAQAGAVLAFSRTGERLGRVDVGGAPTQLALTGDGHTLVVPNRGSGMVSVIDTSTLEERLRIRVPDGPHPHGVALDTGGEVAFVTYEGAIDQPGGVVAIDLATGDLVWRQEVGFYTLGIAYAAPRP